MTSEEFDYWAKWYDSLLADPDNIRGALHKRIVWAHDAEVPRYIEEIKQAVIMFTGVEPHVRYLNHDDKHFVTVTSEGMDALT
jgi:hypothetical protein